jgi:hypothetical protein
MSEDNDNPGIRRTQYVVFGIIGLAMVVLAFTLGGPWIGLGLVLLLLYEAYTLVDKWKDNTISEIIWLSASRPLVPLLFGTAWGAWLMHLTYLPAISPKSLWLASAVSLLLGHFFFQAKREEQKITADTIASNIGKVSLSAELQSREGAVSVVDQTGKVDVIQKAMGIQ